MLAEYPIFVEQVKERFEKLLNPKTFWIHFDGDQEEIHYRIPTVENLSYVLILLHSHSKECVQNGFDRLSRLLNFFVSGHGFSETLHDYPEVKSFNEQILLLAILKRIHDQYGKYLKDELAEKLERIVQELFVLFDQKTTNEVQRKKWQALLNQKTGVTEFTAKDLGEYLLYSTVPEDAFLLYDEWTGTLAKGTVEKRVGFQEEMTPFHLLAQFCAKKLNCKQVPSSLLRYLPLFDAGLLQRSFQKRGTVSAVIQKGQGLQINFPFDYSIYFHSSHPISVQEKEEGFVLLIEYPEEPLDEKESIIETQIFCTKKEEFTIRADQKKVTTFPLEDLVTITDSANRIVASFSSEAIGGSFLGTISFGNRPLQKLKGYVPYDQIIGFRTVQRGKNAQLKIDFTFLADWSPLVLNTATNQ
jgi:hypothetical protein